MSEEKATSQFGLVTRIMGMLNLGDAGKLNSFVTKLIKSAESSITTLKHNQITQNLTYDRQITEYEEQLEDAKVDLGSTYEAIPMDRIETNSAQKEYMAEYLRNIESAEERVERIEESIASIKEDKKSFKKTNDLKIKAFEARIEKFKNS